MSSNEVGMNTIAKHVILPALLAVALSGLGLGEALAAPDSQVSATGHAGFVNTITGNVIDLSFSAIQHQDGTVTGEFERRVVTSTGEFVSRIHGTVICLTVAGNIARIGGIITESSGSAAPPGTDVFTTVVDNGQGENDLDDLAAPGGSGPPGTALTFCATGVSRFLFPVTTGNIQVRPTGL
jgi:hypothetical protein